MARAIAFACKDVDYEDIFNDHDDVDDKTRKSGGLVGFNFGFIFVQRIDKSLSQLV